jgi:hypothetical protein
MLYSQAKITDAYQLVSANLARMTFEQKRLALEAIRVQTWVYQDRVEVWQLAHFFPQSCKYIGMNVNR